MKFLTAALCLAASLGAALAHGQAQTPPPKLDEKSPVTLDEVRASFARLEAVLVKRHKVSIPATKLPAGSSPATRAQIVGEIVRLFDALRPKFRFTPRPPRTYDAVIDARNDPALAKDLNRLIRFGMVAPVGPLATGPGPNLTPQQLGDALGFAFVQMGGMLHQPDPKWSPDISKP